MNTTVTVMITATGSPLSRVGVNTHWRTAVSAASVSIGLPEITFALRTFPSSPISASIVHRALDPRLLRDGG